MKFKVQVGPLLRNQAVTKQIVAAFSFTLNTNLNTTPRQLVSAAIDSRRVHALVFKFCVQTIAEEKKITGENAFSFTQPYTSHLYRFKFNRAYIKPEPNQNQHHWHCLWKGKTKCNHYLLPELGGKSEKNHSKIWFII